MPEIHSLRASPSRRTTAVILAIVSVQPRFNAQSDSFVNEISVRINVPEYPAVHEPLAMLASAYARQVTVEIQMIQGKDALSWAIATTMSTVENLKFASRLAKECANVLMLAAKSNVVQTRYASPTIIDQLVSAPMVTLVTQAIFKLAVSQKRNHLYAKTLANLTRIVRRVISAHQILRE